jgi:hypothetical protein
VAQLPERFREGLLNPAPTAVTKRPPATTRGAFEPSDEPHNPRGKPEPFKPIANLQKTLLLCEPRVTIRSAWLKRKALGLRDGADLPDEHRKLLLPTTPELKPYWQHVLERFPQEGDLLGKLTHNEAPYVLPSSEIAERELSSMNKAKRENRRQKEYRLCEAEEAMMVAYLARCREECLLLEGPTSQDAHDVLSSKSAAPDDDVDSDVTLQCQDGPLKVTKEQAELVNDTFDSLESMTADAVLALLPMIAGPVDTM